MSDMIKFYVGVYEERTGKHPERVGKTDIFIVGGEEIFLSDIIKTAFPAASMSAEVKEMLKKRKEVEG